MSKCFLLPCCIKYQALNISDLLSHTILIGDEKGTFKSFKILVTHITLEVILSTLL